MPGRRGTWVWVGFSCLAVAAAAHAGSLPAGSAPSPWVVQDRNDDPKDGYVLYQRKVPGSDFPAFRLEAVVDAPPALVADAAQRNMADPSVAPPNTTKKILRDDPDVTVVYTYSDMPLVSDRDVTTRIVRSSDPQSGSYRIDWSATDEGPPPRKGVVRLKDSSGSWVFDPLPGGHTRAIYENHADLGGAIPAWLLSGLMGHSMVDGLVQLRTRVEQEQRQMAAEPREQASETR